MIGDLPVCDVTTDHVMAILQPIWTTKTETASRVRGRIESILSWAKVRGYREGENPALWRGHLDNLLPKRSRVAPVKHHAALPYSEVASHMTRLRQHDATAYRALEFLILTATRTSEVIKARWDEVDLDQAVWTIPAERIKTRREHRVPLSPRAVEVLRTMQKRRESDFIFPGAREGKPLSSMAMTIVMRKGLGIQDATVHGFRSTFRDWTSECTNYPREVAEAALSHRVHDQVEAAYRRGDLFAKRRNLMEEWASHCANSTRN